MKKILLYKLIISFCLVIFSTESWAQSSLVLNGGVITINNGAKLLIDNPNVDAILSTGGYIVSEGEDNQVIWNIGNAVGTFIVPWGIPSGTTFSFAVLVLPGANGVNGALEFSTYGTASNNLPLPSMVTHLNNNLTGLNNSLYTIDRFWLINSTNYITKPQVVLDFKYITGEHQAPNTITESNLQAQRFNTTINEWGDWGPVGLGTPATNTVGGASLSVSPNDFFTAWTLVDNAQPLPIELLAFDAKCNDNFIEINWTTASETNNVLFNIYRSFENIPFEIIHSTPGTFNSVQVLQYTFEDYDIIPGLTYQYKLEQVDVDGNRKLFNAIEKGPCNFKHSDVSVYYDMSGIITIKGNAEWNEDLRIVLVNKLGQYITMKKWNPHLQGSTLAIPVRLSSGMYFVRILNERINETQKVLVN